MTVYREQWLVVDGKQYDGDTFVECILEHRGGSGTALRNCHIDRCDTVGPGWATSLQGDFEVRATKPEPEVALAASRRRRWQRK